MSKNREPKRVSWSMDPVDVQVHRWLTVLVSAQAILDDPTRRILYGIRIADQDPGDVLAVSTVLEGHDCWVNPGDGLDKLRRGCLTTRVDTLPAAILDTLDMRLSATLDL